MYGVTVFVDGRGFTVFGEERCVTNFKILSHPDQRGFNILRLKQRKRKTWL